MEFHTNKVRKLDTNKFVVLHLCHCKKCGMIDNSHRVVMKTYLDRPVITMSYLLKVTNGYGYFSNLGRHVDVEIEGGQLCSTGSTAMMMCCYMETAVFKLPCISQWLVVIITYALIKRLLTTVTANPRKWSKLGV